MKPSMRARSVRNGANLLPILFFVLILCVPEGVTALGKVSTSSQQQHDLFLGLAWSTDLGLGSWSAIGQPTIESITTVITLGDRRFLPLLPIRGRLSVGWFPGHPFRLGAGVEVALFELLNGYHARGFGIYAFLDEILLVDKTATLAPRAMLGILLPITPTGGICVAAGVTKGWQPAITLTLMNGGYPQ